MAGIGFKIQKLLDKNTYVGAVQGYLLGAFVSSGPLIVTVLCIGALSALSSLQVAREDIVLFRVTLVHVYAISLIVSAMIQLNATRFIADVLFCNENHRVLPCLFTLLLLSTALNTAVGIAFFQYTKLGVWYIFRTVALLVIVSNIWITMIFITATKEYLTITFAFVIGSGVAIIAGNQLGRKCGIIGYLEGYTIGQSLIFAALFAVVAREFPLNRNPIDFSFLRSLLKYPELLLTGVFLNLGLWVDKFVLWHSHYAESIHNILRSFDAYDSCAFLAYLSVIPTLTVFFIKVETSFYLRFRKYFDIITNKGSYEDIEKARDGVVETLSDGVGQLVVVQSLATAVCLVCATPIMKFIGLSPIQWGMFRVCLIGSMLLVLTQILIILMLYLEFRYSALAVAVILCLSNIVFTLVTLRLGFQYLGYGFTAAGFLALVIGYWLMERNMKRFIFLTFSSQPIPKPAKG